MNNLNDEQRERLAEVRENRRIWHGNMGQVTRDIDFLLSLIDSKAAESAALDDDKLVAEMNKVAVDLVGEWYRESQHRDELTDEIAITLTHAHRRAEANAASAMRDRCVETVRGLRPSALGAGAFKDAAVKALQALTLEEKQQS